MSDTKERLIENLRVQEQHLRLLLEKEASDKHGEALFERECIDLKIVGMRIHGELVQVDLPLSKMILRPDDQSVRSLSGLNGVKLDSDNYTLIRLSDEPDVVWVRWEILDWQNNVSVSARIQDGPAGVTEVFVKLISSKVYLPRI